MLSIIKENIKKRPLSILDLGCGKGAVSVNIAKEIDCKIKAIDAMPEFIEIAKRYAKDFKVQDKCDFKVGDIRTEIWELKGFDVIILGAIGQIFGDLQTTLKTLTQSLNNQGYVLLDDGYIEDNSQADYDRCLRQSDFYNQITLAGFEIIREIIFEKEAIADSDMLIYDSIMKRVNELIIMHPEKNDLFEGYLKSQEYENYMLAAEIIGGMWLLRAIGPTE
jgi:cyclopropane fatty-acyl-phospholipid synthase-like methyltransferase